MSVQAQESTENASSAAASSPNSTSPEASKNNNTVERIEVVGSRIKRIAKEGAAPVKDLGKESMKNSANTSASDSMRDSTMATYGAARESSGGSAAATATIGLRGLGDTRTLVLLNGHRLPKDPSYEAVDLNLIPQSAIEKIEVLKDGASALYGSDALGGVINIITKKNLVGNEATAKLSAVEKPGGTVYSLSNVSGFNTENSNLLVSLNYTHTDKIMGRNRDVTKEGLSPIGNPGTWFESNGTAHAEANCPPELLVTDSDGTYCYYKYNAVASSRPQIGQINLLTDYTYRFGSGMKFYNRNIVVHKDIEWNYAPAPAYFSTPTGTASNPNATDIYHRYLEVGNRDNKDSEFNFITLFGLKGNLTSVWEYDVSAGYSEINRKERGVHGYLDKSVLKALVASGAHDPLAPVGSQGDVSSAIVNPFQDASTKLLNADLVINGELGEIGDRPIGVATGVSVFNEKLDQKTDDKTIAKVVIGGSGSNDSGSRDVQSAFVEAALPLTETLELSPAARIDHYSDFGTSINPKLSAKWEINPSFLLRSSIGTGFKAPTLSQVYGGVSDGNPSFIDRVDCANGGNCSSSQYHVYGGGNRDLKEEKALSYSLGTVIQPASRLAIALDGWYTKVSGIVGINYEGLTQAELNGVDLTQYGILVKRKASGKIDFIEAKNLNLQEEEISGIDMNLDLIISNDFMGYALNFENDFSYIVFDKLEEFPTLGKRNVIGEWGFPNWRNSATLSLKNDSTSYSLTMRSIPGQNVQDRLIDEKISDLNEWDLSASHKLDKNVQISGGIKNIMNAKQPADQPKQQGDQITVNNGLYDINGRKFFITYSEKF